MAPFQPIDQTTIQEFLHLVARLEVPVEQRKRFGLRFTKTPEVFSLISILQGNCTTGVIEREVSGADLNAIVSVIKEILARQFSGVDSTAPSLFEAHIVDHLLNCPDPNTNNEYSLSLAVDYVNKSMRLFSVPVHVRRLSYLFFKALRNLARQCLGRLIDAYTDLLLLFTPLLFPGVRSDASKLVRMSRVCLILIDLCEHIFPFFHPNDHRSDSESKTQSQTATGPTMTDSAYFSDGFFGDSESDEVKTDDDEEFFNDVCSRLDQLQNSFFHAPNVDSPSPSDEEGCSEAKASDSFSSNSSTGEEDFKRRRSRVRFAENEHKSFLEHESYYTLVYVDG